MAEWLLKLNYNTEMVNKKEDMENGYHIYIYNIT